MRKVLRRTISKQTLSDTAVGSLATVITRIIHQNLRAVRCNSGSKPIPALERLPKLRLRYIPEPPNFITRLPFILAGPLKVLHQITAVLIVLLFLIRVPPEFILVQVKLTC
jgi:hypothetical protein